MYAKNRKWCERRGRVMHAMQSPKGGHFVHETMQHEPAEIICNEQHDGENRGDSQPMQASDLDIAYVHLQKSSYNQCSGELSAQ